MEKVMTISIHGMHISKRNTIIRGKKKNLAGICIGYIFFLHFWSCFEAKFLHFMRLSLLYLKTYKETQKTSKQTASIKIKTNAKSRK